MGPVYIIIVTEFAKGVLYMHPIPWLWRGMTSFVSQLLGRNFQSYKSNDRTVLLPNFKAVGQRYAELHSFKAEKLDACIRPFSQIRSQLFPYSGSVFTMILLCYLKMSWYLRLTIISWQSCDVSYTTAILNVMKSTIQCIVITNIYRCLYVYRTNLTPG